MVASKKAHCAFCQKKCSGNVLRYQDQYYHKQCFEQQQQQYQRQQSVDGGGGDDGASPQDGAQSDESDLFRSQEVASRSHNKSDNLVPPSPKSRGDGFHHHVKQQESRVSPSSQRLNVSGNNVDDAEQLLQNYNQPPSTRSNTQVTRIFTSHSQHNLTTTNNTPSPASTSKSKKNNNKNDHTDTGSLGQKSMSSSRQSVSTSMHQKYPTASGSTSHLFSKMQTPQQQQAVTSERYTKSNTLQQQQASHKTTTPPSAAARSSASLPRPNNLSAPSSNGFSNNNNNNSNNTSAISSPLLSTTCASCKQQINDGQALIALDSHWHVWCFKCTQCKSPLHGEYVAKDGRAYCERDYQKLFGITCVYCKRYITGKVLQAGDAHHFHPSCARCSKCGDPFVPGEEMYLQGEVTWHPRCGPGPTNGQPESSLLDGSVADDRSQLRSSRVQSPSLSSRSRSRSASPFSYMSRQYGRASPVYADSEAVGDLSRIYTISYLNADPNQGYLRRPVEPSAPKSPQFSRPTSMSRLGAAAGTASAISDRSRCSSRSQQYVYQSGARERSVPRGMYSVLSSVRSNSSSRARSPSMMNEEAIQMASYPSGQKPSPDSVPKIERDDFPAPPFPYHPDATCTPLAKTSRHESGHHHHHVSPLNAVKDSGQSTAINQQQQQRTSARQLTSEANGDNNYVHHHHQERASRPRSREINGIQATTNRLSLSMSSSDGDENSTQDPQFRKEEEELSKIANGIGKIFLQTLKEREKLRAWKRANLDPRNASRTPSATRELHSRLRYENPTNASPSRDLDRPRPWEEDELAAANNQGDQSPTRTRSSLGRSTAGGGGAASSALSSSAYGYKVIQSNRSTPKPGYGLSAGPGSVMSSGLPHSHSESISFVEQQRMAQARANDLLGRQSELNGALTSSTRASGAPLHSAAAGAASGTGSVRSLASAAHLRRSMPNVAALQHQHYVHTDGPPKLYPYHLLATSNYRLPPDIDRCHLERHLSNEEFQYIFHCDRLDFYRLPEWKRNELKRRAKLF